MEYYFKYAERLYIDLIANDNTDHVFSKSRDINEGIFSIQKFLQIKPYDIKALNL